MQISGELMIFKNDFGYSTSISAKNREGKYEYMPISVQFKKDDPNVQNITNKSKINVTNGFLTFYRSTSGEKKVKIFVMEFETLNVEREEYQDPFDDMQVVEDYSDGDLPF